MTWKTWKKSWLPSTMSICPSSHLRQIADQLFPIMPIHRLNEDPTRRGILADLT